MELLSGVGGVELLPAGIEGRASGKSEQADAQDQQKRLPVPFSFDSALIFHTSAQHRDHGFIIQCHDCQSRMLHNLDPLDPTITSTGSW